MDVGRRVVPQPKQEAGFVFPSLRENSSLTTQTFVTHLHVAVVPGGHADGPSRTISRAHSFSQGPPLNPISTRSETTRHRTILSLPVGSASAHLNRFKNYRLCQDLTTGRLTLEHVRCPTPSDTSQTTPLSLGSTREQQTICSTSTTPQSVDGSTGSVGGQPPSFLPDFQNLGSRSRQREPAGSGHQDRGGCLGVPPGSSGLPARSALEVDGEPPELGRYLHPALREVIDRLKGESDHCTANSQEGQAMGIGNFIT